MYRIEDNGQYPEQYQNQKRGIGWGGLLLRLFIIGLAIFGVVKLFGGKDAKEVVYVRMEDTVNKTEENTAIPINTKYSVKGNYYSVFTQQQNVTDNFGTVYDTAYVAKVGINSVAKKLTYDLSDSSYTTLHGTIALSEKNKDNINCFCVAVYNENGDMIYKSAEISDKSPEPIEINCDISGLSRVTIELEGCTMTCSSIEILMPGEGFVFA